MKQKPRIGLALVQELPGICSYRSASGIEKWHPA